jgi:predicted DNA-binding protein
MKHKPKVAPKKLTGIRMNPGQWERLEQIGAKLDRPVSWLIRKAIDEFIERNEEK